jgi:pimeloyl-ACP methyl ester carboxylesterase
MVHSLRRENFSFAMRRSQPRADSVRSGRSPKGALHMATAVHTRGKARGGSSGSKLKPIALAVAAAALAASAAFNIVRARQADRDHPPTGKFLEVDGVRLHYVERGEGRPLLLLHGNAASIGDMEASGLLDRASETYRVIAFDRPGYGHSTRPRTRIWTPEAQAALLWKAMRSLGISQPIILGHSWGTLVAIAMALDEVNDAAGLVLVSGYYFPSARPDAVLLSPPAIPLIGDAMRYTFSPLFARLMKDRLIRRLFSPAVVPASFDGYPVELGLRPGQLRASAAEAAMMVPAAARLSKEYHRLDLPIAIVTGDGDGIVRFDEQSARLNDALPGSELMIVEGAGHMVHYLDVPAVLRAVDRTAAASETIGDVEAM